MGLIVQKYGGTSVANAERIKAVAERVKRWRDEGHRVVVVVSAMSGETDRLVGLAKQIQERPLPRELDVLLSTGEQVTIALLSMALDDMGCAARSYTGGQVHILTDSVHNKARIHDIDGARVGADLAAGRVVVIAGFQGVDTRCPCACFPASKKARVRSLRSRKTSWKTPKSPESPSVETRPS